MGGTLACAGLAATRLFTSQMPSWYGNWVAQSSG